MAGWTVLCMDRHTLTWEPLLITVLLPGKYTASNEYNARQMDRHTYTRVRKPERQTDRQIDRQPDTHSDRQGYGQTGRRAGRQAGMAAHMGRYAD